MTQHDQHSATDWEPEVRSRSDRLAARLTDRRNRTKVILGGGGVAIVIAVVVILLTSGGSQPATVDPGALITTFLPGEMQQVPNACTVLPASTLRQYLPGTAKLVSPPLNNGSASQCSWTLDRHPEYRLIDMSIQAYSPSGLASGDGSATFAAIDAFAESQQAKQDPGPHSGQPKAQISTLPGLGNAAFSAAQVFHAQGGATDVVTVVVRYRNVLITVIVNNFARGGLSSMSQIAAAAQSIAQDVTGKVVH